MNNAETDKIDLEEITDNLKYARMAMLVDKEEFIISIKKTRKLLGLTKPLEYDKAGKWLHRSNRNSSLNKMDTSNKETFRNVFRLSQSISGLKEKFHKNVNYTNAIRYAILAGKITDKEFTTTAFCTKYPFSKKFEEAELSAEWPMVAIFVNPETKKEEVLSLLNTEVKKLFNKIYNDSKLQKRASGNIKRDRDWYWLHKDGKSYQEIADLDGKKILGFRDVVIKAIKQYKRNLGVEK